MKPRRGKQLRPPRHNPVARTLRDPALRARRVANQRRFSRKLKHGSTRATMKLSEDDENRLCASGPPRRLIASGRGLAAAAISCGRPETPQCAD